MRFTRSRRGSGHAEVQVCVRITCVDKDGERTQSIRELTRGHVSVSRISLHSGEELLPWSDACIWEKTPNKGTARSSTTVSHLHFPTNSEITREPGETAAAYSCIWQHVSFSKQRNCFSKTTISKRGGQMLRQILFQINTTQYKQVCYECMSVSLMSVGVLQLNVINVWPKWAFYSLYFDSPQVNLLTSTST